MKQTLLIIVTVFVLSYGIFFRSAQKTEESDRQENIPEESIVRTDITPSSEETPGSEKTSKTAVSKPIGRVPFVIQAPGGAWDDPIFQDGCEEASLLMVDAWLEGKTLSDPEAAADAIRALADFEVKRFGYHQDISLPEIVSVFREYFRYDQAMLLEDITLSGIRQELSDGNIVLAPTFGQALQNPNFKSPGPITHILVLTGYDKSTKEFIVNDPGTKHGEGYHYDENILFDAIWAYPSGRTHPEPPEPDERIKSVLVISRR